MRASVSCQGAGADTITTIVYKWPEKYTRLVWLICCPISALHGRYVYLYKAGEIRCDLARALRHGEGTPVTMKLQERRRGR